MHSGMIKPCIDGTYTVVSNKVLSHAFFRVPTKKTLEDLESTYLTQQCRPVEIYGFETYSGLVERSVGITFYGDLSVNAPGLATPDKWWQIHR